MSTNKIDNLNPALATNWQITFAKFPEIVYFVQSVVLPSITMSAIPTHFRNFQTKFPDNKIDFGELNFTFLIDEDFINYDKLFKSFLTHEMSEVGQGHTIRPVFSDITLTRLSSNNVEISRFTFTDCFLTMLGSVSYNATTVEPDVLVCDATFAFTRMDIAVANKSYSFINKKAP